MYANVLYYKYVLIEDPIAFRDAHRELCRSLNLKGKVLVAKEGINGCVSGTLEDTDAYMDTLKTDPRFADVNFKIGHCEEHTFSKMIVRARPEIVTFDADVDLNNAAPYIDAKELKSLLDAGEDVVLIDARNKYEADFGTFQNAIVPDIETFKTFPTAAKDWEHLKDKQVVTFCTGGIRCEKASAYLVEQGFTNVRQLHNGILTYGKEVGSEHWDGGCFVFDQRVQVDMDDALGIHSNDPEVEFCCVAPFKKAFKE